MFRDIKSAFLGQNAENLDYLESMIVEALRDHAYWRRNFHPEDKILISEFDKISKEFIESKALLHQSLFEILAKLKNGVPFFSNRYLGHMNSDLLIPAIVGYFASMLYNQNNVVAESSPVTVEKELQFISNISKMIKGGIENYNVIDDFDNSNPSEINQNENSFKVMYKAFLENVKERKNTSWGHLASCGTSANMEALWTIRNVKFFPLSLKLYYSILNDTTQDKFSEREYLKKVLNEINKEENNLKNSIEFILKQSEYGNLLNMSPYELLSLRPDICLSIWDKVKDKFNELVQNDEISLKKIKSTLPTLQNLGIFSFISLCNKYDLNFNSPVMLVTKAAHYCWKKSFEVIGLGNGSNNFIQIDVDNEFRISIKDLKEKLNKLHNDEIPVLSLVSVTGTTEEGSIDSLDEIIKMKNILKSNNLSYWIHSDAAYGGYFRAISKEQWIDIYKYNSEILTDEENKKRDYIYKNLEALKSVDSLVIDPHKQGYIPYPAAIVMYKDSRIRDHIQYKAPYLRDNDDIYKTLLGQWTLEGSRPGATAISCYLSQKCFPLNSEGYGMLLTECLKGTKKIIKTFDDFNRRERDFKIEKLFSPDLNIVCYVVTSQIKILNRYMLNLLNKKIFDTLTVKGDTHSNYYPYIISQTEYNYNDYKEIIEDFLTKKVFSNTQEINYEPNNENFELFVLRTVVMNPLSSDTSVRYEGFTNELKKIAEDSLTEVYLNEFKRVIRRKCKIMIIEDDESTISKFKEYELYTKYGALMEIIAVKSKDEAKEKIKSDIYDSFIIDLNLEKVGDQWGGYDFINEELPVNFSVFSNNLNANQPLKRNIQNNYKEKRGIVLGDEYFIQKPDVNIDRKQEENFYTDLLNSLILRLLTKN